MRIECTIEVHDLKFEESFSDFDASTLVHQKFKEFLASLTPSSADPVKLIVKLEVRNLGQDSPTKISFYKQAIMRHDARSRKI